MMWAVACRRHAPTGNIGPPWFGFHEAVFDGGICMPKFFPPQNSEI